MTERDLERELIRLLKTANPAAIKRGMGKAGLVLMNDCLRQVPTVPKDEGTLRGSGSVFVDNKLIKTSADMGNGGTPATAMSDAVKQGVSVATVGFNTPYAARLHEHPEFEFKEPSAGGKFEEEPMNRNRMKYMQIVATELQKIDTRQRDSHGRFI